MLKSFFEFGNLYAAILLTAMAAANPEAWFLFISGATNLVVFLFLNRPD